MEVIHTVSAESNQLGQDIVAVDKSKQENGEVS